MSRKKTARMLRGLKLQMEFSKCLASICFLILIADACKSSRLDESFDSIFKQFKRVFHKKYSRNEESRRKCILKTSMGQIMKHNFEFDLGKHKYRLGLNKYSDMTHKEFVTKMNGFLRHPALKTTGNSSMRYPGKRDATTYPAKLDYRDEGIVTPVKDQEGCGACWAFSALAALESQLLRKGIKKLDLSEQNLVDCSSSYGNKGCRGGFMTRAFDYIIGNGGIEAETSYPYKAKEGRCRFREYNVAATCSRYEEIDQGDEDLLLHALIDVGPICVAMDARRPSFQNYKGGIYDDPWCSSRYLDHAVLLIGYGAEDGVDYWLIKNSYGKSWGEDGYVRIARNKKNLCGVASQPSFPIV